MPIPAVLDLGSGAGPGVPGAVTQGRLATLGDISFGAVDPYGSLVYLNNIKGWSGGGASTGDVEQRANDHGGWAGSAFYTPRTYELDVTVVGGSYRLTEQSVDRIVSLIPLSTLETLMVVSTDGSALLADVRQQGETLSDQKGAVARMSISLVAPDPRRYETGWTEGITGLPTTSGGLSLPISLPVSVNAVMTGGTLQATNGGNMSTRPVFTVSGPCPAFAITHLATGKTLRFADSIAAGRSLVIDTDKRSAVLDGTARRVVTGTWFEYAPGLNEVAFSAATYDPAALLVSSHRSAWR